MVDNTNTQLLLDGSKTFWKSRHYLKVLIILHKQQNCLEVITYNPTDGTEYRRLYLDSPLILSKLDKEIIDSTYLAKKEALNRAKRSKDKEELLSEIRMHMMMQYAYVRISENLDANDGISVFLQPSFDDLTVEGDDGTMKIDVERMKPDDLIPYSDFKKTITTSKVDEFQAAYTELTKDSAAASNEVAKATRSCKMATAAMSGFVTAFRRKSIFDLKKKMFSYARQKWMTAIHKVIVLNYVQGVKRRLSASPLFKGSSWIEQPPAETPSPTAAAAAVSAAAAMSKTTVAVTVQPKRKLGDRALGNKKRSFCDENIGLSTPSLDAGFFGETSTMKRGATAGSGLRQRGGALRGSFDDSHIMEPFSKPWATSSSSVDSIEYAPCSVLVETKTGMSAISEVNLQVKTNSPRKAVNFSTSPPLEPVSLGLKAVHRSPKTVVAFAEEFESCKVPAVLTPKAALTPIHAKTTVAAQMRNIESPFAPSSKLSMLSTTIIAPSRPSTATSPTRPSTATSSVRAAVAEIPVATAVPAGAWTTSHSGHINGLKVVKRVGSSKNFGAGESTSMRRSTTTGAAGSHLATMKSLKLQRASSDEEAANGVKLPALGKVCE